MVLVIYLVSMLICILGCVCVNDLTARQAKEYDWVKSQNREPISLLIIEVISSLMLLLCPVINTICAVVIMYCLNVEELRDGLISNQLEKYYE